MYHHRCVGLDHETIHPSANVLVTLVITTLLGSLNPVGNSHEIGMIGSSVVGQVPRQGGEVTTEPGGIDLVVIAGELDEVVSIGECENQMSTLSIGKGFDVVSQESAEVFNRMNSSFEQLAMLCNGLVIEIREDLEMTGPVTFQQWKLGTDLPDPLFPIRLETAIKPDLQGRAGGCLVDGYFEDPKTTDDDEEQQECASHA